MKTATGLILVVAIATAGACGSSLAETASEPREDSPNHKQEAAALAQPSQAAWLRAEGPTGLRKALALYDDASGDSERAKLETLVDSVAAQRYATYSRLFWHTDLDEAKARAQQESKPILSLRMLGRLDKDLSCANSRMFRVVLYANREVSNYLRKNVVLHWSSERDVPQIKIQFGDGRSIETTVGGNSLHYVLDSQGRPVDALPGLYGPKIFLRVLKQAVATAHETNMLDESQRRTELANYHARVVAETEEFYAGPSRPAGMITQPSLIRRRPGTISIAEAEQLTVMKALIEQPTVYAVDLGAPLIKTAKTRDVRDALARLIKIPVKLDSQSQALIVKLAPTDWKESPEPLKKAGLARLVGQLEYSVAADSILAELGLHRQIHGVFQNLEFEMTFDKLNAYVYKHVFLTPAEDPWMGMATRGVFTGVPRDGLTGK